MPEDLDQEKIKKNGYKIWTKKFLSEDGEKINLKIKINNSLKELLQKFAVMDEIKEFNGYGLKKRYKIKTVLVRSYNFNDLHYMFFTPEMMKNNEVVLSFDENRYYQTSREGLHYIRDFLKIMQELSNEEEVEYDIEVKKKEVL